MDEHRRPGLLYCQTLENKSSFPPAPLAGFAAEVAAGPALLVQPPNSSSAATFGAGAKPPEEPGIIGWLARELPELPQPKSLVAPRVDGLGASWLFLAGPAFDHALSPHTSAPDQLLEPPRVPGTFELVVVAAAGARGGLGPWVLERLKTELAWLVGEAIAGFGASAGAGPGAGAAGVEKSKRSSRPEEAGWDAGLGGAAVVVIEAKPPRPLPLLKDCVAAGGEVGVGFGLKKLPPLRLENADVLDCGAGREELEKLPRLANASFCGLFWLVDEVKLRPLKASSRPPNDP